MYLAADMVDGKHLATHFLHISPNNSERNLLLHKHLDILKALAATSVLTPGVSVWHQDVWSPGAHLTWPSLCAAWGKGTIETQVPYI